MIINKLKNLRDQDIEVVMGNLLRTGVIISASVVALGGILYLVQSAFSPAHFSTFIGEPAALKNFSQIISGALSFQSLSIIQLGLLLLIATPVARVAFSVIGFLLEKDHFYTVVTIFVLIVLIFSLTGGVK